MAVSISHEVSQAFVRLESELPEGVRFYESPNFAPPGFIAIGAHARVFPIYDASSGAPTCRYTGYLESVGSNGNMVAPFEFNEGELIADIVSKIRDTAQKLKEISK